MRLCCCVALALICGLAPAEELKPVQSKEQPNVFNVQATFGIVNVRIRSPIVYKTNHGEPAFSEFANVAVFDESGAFLEKTGNFFATSPPRSLKIQSDSPGLKLDRNDADYHYRFTEFGSCKIRFDIGQDHFFIPVEVKPIDFSIGESSDRLIESLGLPSKKTRVFVPWPEVRVFDGIVYSATGGYSVSREHWRFDKIPHAVFVIDPANKISEITSDTQSPEIDIDSLLGNETALKITADDGKDPKLPVERDFREWENRLGQKTVLKFVKYKYPGVLFVTRGGDEIAYRLKDLSDADAALVQKLHAEEVRAAKEARQKKAAAAK
jgi:hypothetical protein